MVAILYRIHHAACNGVRTIGGEAANGVNAADPKIIRIALAAEGVAPGESQRAILFFRAPAAYKTRVAGEEPNVVGVYDVVLEIHRSRAVVKVRISASSRWDIEKATLDRWRGESPVSVQIFFTVRH